MKPQTRPAQRLLECLGGPKDGDQIMVGDNEQEVRVFSAKRVPVTVDGAPEWQRVVHVYHRARGKSGRPVLVYLGERAE